MGEGKGPLPAGCGLLGSHVRPLFPGRRGGISGSKGLGGE